MKVRKIYLLLDSEKIGNREKAIFFFTKFIAQRNEFNLVICLDKKKEIDSHFFGQSDWNYTISFFCTKGCDGFFYDFIRGKQKFHDSVAFIRDIKFLTLELFREFDAIVLDQRNLANNVKIKIPETNTDFFSFSNKLYNIKTLEYFEILKNEDFDTCTLITSMYRTEIFLQGFYENITSLIGYDSYPHRIFFSTLNDIEYNIILKWHHVHSNVILAWYRNDPGLYEFWNIGIRTSSSFFISNANVDDLRDSEHVVALLENLRTYPHVAVSATAIIAFDKYCPQLEKIDTSEPWYIELAGEFGMDELAELKYDDKEKWVLKPNNLPHCMPIWRRSVHLKFGYFNESRYGTFADWAFWLKITKNGEKGYLNPKPLSYYFINDNSHNRRGEKLKHYHSVIERDFLDTFYNKFQNKTRECMSVSKLAYKDNKIVFSLKKKLNLKRDEQCFGIHRNSFNRLIKCLSPLDKGEGGIDFIPFIERYFVWGDDKGEALSSNPYPIKNKWIGIIHVPFDAPKWFENTVSPEVIFETNLWKLSMPYCQGLICLTNDIQKDLGYYYPNLSSISVKHPTELNVIEFNWNAYIERPRLLQAGDWLRRLQAIYEVNAKDHEKIMLLKPSSDVFLNREIAVLGDFRNNTVTVHEMVSNDEYDDLLSSSVVIIWLYATAANNLILECIARCTPIIINPIPGVVEYLGKDYPLYMTSLSEVEIILADRDKIFSAHVYLQKKKKNDLSYESFFNEIAMSGFYDNL